MLSAILASTLALAATTSASPILSKRAGVPPTSSSTGFSLVANVTDQINYPWASDVNNWKVSGSHVGAGQSRMILQPSAAPTTIFYQNGTEGITRDSSNDYPFSIALGPLYSDPTVQYVGINVGEGTKGVSVGSVVAKVDVGAPTDPTAQGTFVVCLEDQQYQIRYAPTAVPEGCAPVSLVAKCEALENLDESGLEYHRDTPAAVSCYENPGSIVWSDY
ncbi:hypothetical protein B0T17DRAFT_273781 [Bombardia bombarda]|uniref:DUF7907 domain-containing protein n=1 Tax=Bombardia bombarda TaxID=252184 RepID=A0AA39X1A5_9PEZI|nr:hypothetical protein B0T17DRAFT_273781 [Bombardia bombarda]